PDVCPGQWSAAGDRHLQGYTVRACPTGGGAPGLIPSGRCSRRALALGVRAPPLPLPCLQAAQAGPRIRSSCLSQCPCRSRCGSYCSSGIRATNVHQGGCLHLAVGKALERLSSENLGSLALVVFEEASKPFTTPHRACTLWGLTDHRKEEHVALPLMIPLVMI